MVIWKLRIPSFPKTWQRYFWKPLSIVTRSASLPRLFNLLAPKPGKASTTPIRRKPALNKFLIFFLKNTHQITAVMRGQKRNGKHGSPCLRPKFKNPPKQVRFWVPTITWLFENYKHNLFKKHDNDTLLKTFVDYDVISKPAEIVQFAGTSTWQGINDSDNSNFCTEPILNNLSSKYPQNNISIIYSFGYIDFQKKLANYRSNFLLFAINV